MIIYVSVFIGAFILGFIAGWITGRKRFSQETAVQVIQNLKDTMKIYEATHEEQMAALTQKYIDLKLAVLKLMEENKILMDEIARKK